MKFSVIMPSLLADFPGSATGKDKKLVRAIQSVIDQTFTDFELIIISDGCALTKYLVSKTFAKEIKSEKINLLYVNRKQLFSNFPRNEGIAYANGEYIIYLDSDDRWGDTHLQTIDGCLNNEDWVYFNDWSWDVQFQIWRQRPTDVTQYGKCGTSNICHKASLNLRWIETGYGHDYAFIQQLRKFENNKQINTAEYFVCHIGNMYCV